jgi:thiol-disulfide isomerase/thioredoxin
MNRRSNILSLTVMAALTLAAAPAWSQKTVLPRKAPEIAVKLPGGRDLLLSSLRGKVVVMEFMFTTCPHCQDASRLMSRLYTEYGPRGFQPIGVAFNDMAMMLVPEFVAMFKVNYPVGVATRDQVLDFLTYTEQTRLMVPAMCFIDRKGMIRYQTPLDSLDESGKPVDYHSEANMRKLIETLLAERGTPPAPTRKPIRKK